MILMDFQKRAVDELSKSFFNLWQTTNYRLPLVFKAPTGAGKTIMMAEFLRTLDGNYHFDDDKVSTAELNSAEIRKKNYEL